MAANIADRCQSPPLTARSPSVEGTGVYRQYLPSACVDIRPSLKMDIFVLSKGISHISASVHRLCERNTSTRL